MLRARSLALLCFVLAALAGLLLWLVRADGVQGALVAPREPAPAAEVTPAGPTRIESSDGALAASDSARIAGGGVGVPHLPERAPLDAQSGRVAGWLHPEGARGWRDAWVAILSRDGDAPPMLLAESRVEADGGFSVALQGLPDRAALLVAARGHRPELVDVTLRAGEEVLLEDLRLEPGAEISGALATGAQPLGRFEVVAVDPRELARATSQGGELLWDGQRFDWRYTTAESDEHGRYSIRGLCTGEYGVRVVTCRGPFSSLCTGDRAPRTVNAPASGVDFSFESSRLDLAFTHAGRPVAGVEAELTSGTWRAGRQCDAEGRCSFELVPRLDCDLIATKKGFEVLRMPVRSPASGGRAEQSFELRPEPPSPSVRFLVRAAQGDEVGGLRVQLYPPDDPLPGTAPRAPAVDQALVATPESAKSALREYLLERAPPGTWRAVLIPGHAFTGSLAPESYVGTHCLVQSELIVPAQGELRHELVAERRAGLRLELHDAAGIYASGRCTLRLAESAQELPVVLLDPRRGAPSWTRELAVDGPTLLYTTLCAGRALLTVEREGQVILQQNVEFLPGEITPVGFAR